MLFKDKYTTTDLKNADPVAEKDKAVISNDTYALMELGETIAFKLGRK